MKDPSCQRPGSFKLLVRVKLTSFRVGENSLAHRDRPFNFSSNNSAGDRIEVEVHDIEIVAAINGPHKGDVFIPVMGELVSVATQDAINGSLGQTVDEGDDLVVFTGLLLRLIVTDVVGFVPRTLVSEMGKYQYYFRPIFS